MRKAIGILAFIGLFTFTCMGQQNINPPKLPKMISKNYVFIKPGKVFIEKDSFQLEGFFISKYEISNKEYNLFLQDRKEKGKWSASLEMDTSSWTDSYNVMMVPYKSHPAFQNYPVVSISYEAALEYCKWLEEQLNDEEFEFKVTLPDRNQWVYAAKGNHKTIQYVWGGQLTNTKAVYSCNFNGCSAETIHMNEETNQVEIIKSRAANTSHYTSDNADIWAPVNSYKPSRFGLYNMNGNVAEMALEKGVACGGSFLSYGYDVRNESIMHYVKPQIDIGFRPVIT
ncbi:MAG: SUMF1/EgtB/PvdO family nonheme iron enzyme [Bacteroidetes bacterium]|nr:SUMF1/EgtB/PvdO family nonheme iron enzyme [Bacteroidota bacterium]